MERIIEYVIKIRIPTNRKFINFGFEELGKDALNPRLIPMLRNQI